MSEENTRQCIRVGQLLGLLLGILVFCSSVPAGAEGPSDQHVTGDPAERIWTKDITEPYWTGVDNIYKYYGLLLDLDPGDYSVDCALLLDIKDIWGDAETKIYGVHYANSSGTLEVHNNIDITAAGLIPVEGVVGNAAIYITGIDAGANDVTSSAGITLTATGGTAASSSGDASVFAYGIYSWGEVLDNVGAISSTATGGTADSANAWAYGIDYAGAVTNTGDISSTATGGTADSSAIAEACGIYDSEALDNAGAISSSATGGTATSTYSSASATAYGIHSGGGAVTNKGAISSTATGGTADSSAAAWAYGIYSEGEEGEGEALANSGAISSTAIGGTADSSSGQAFAFAEAHGIYSNGGAVTNTGHITSIAIGGTATVPSALTYYPYAFAEAYGIYSKGGGKAVTNKGAISSTATGGIAGSANAKASAKAYGIYSDGAVTNTGAISATALAGTQTEDGHTTSGDAFAYGIYFTTSGELRSSGLIRAFAQFAPNVDPPSLDASPTAYQVYCEYGTVTIKQYAMEVGHSQDTFTAMYEGQIGTGSNGKIAFDNTELVVYLADDYQNGVYDIPRLWKQETEEEKAATINQFATADTAIPGLTVSLIPSADAEIPQKINMEYAPKESTPLKQSRIQANVEGAIHSLIENNLIERFLSGTRSGDAPTPTASASSFGIGGSPTSMVASVSNPNILPAVTSTGAGQHSLLFLPVYVNSYDSATSGYSSNTYGFVLGYDYKVYEDSNDCIIGVHAGYTRGDIRYTGEDYGDRKEFVDTYYGGVHGLSRFAEDFIFSGEASFFYAESDMRDDDPARLGKADYDSLALRAVATVGYLWDIAEHSIVPEIGLDYSWQHRGSFTANNQNSSDIRYGTLDNNELYAKARLKWLARYELSPTWTIIPLLGVGVTQVLTDGDISNTMRLGNETQLVVDQDENTTFTPEANITVSSDDYQFMAGYTGGFGGTTKNNMFWLQLAVSF